MVSSTNSCGWCGHCSVTYMQSPSESAITYRLMLLGRAAPVVNARLLLTEANVVSEDCGRGRGPSHTTPPSYSLYASCGWERSVAERTPALWVVHAYTEAVLRLTVRDLGHSPRRHHIRTRYTAGVGINHQSSPNWQVTLTYLKRGERVRHVFCELSLRF